MMAWLWEVFDNSLYCVAVLALVLVAISAGACPTVLVSIHQELRELRAEIKAIRDAGCNCRHHLLPMPRRIGEEAD